MWCWSEFIYVCALLEKKKRQLSIAAGNVTLPSLLNLRSHSSAPASCNFFAAHSYSTCSYLVTSLVCVLFFYFIRFFVHTRCVVSCWTEELSGNGQRNILCRRTCSQIRDLWLSSSPPVIRAFWNSVARAEDLLETNTSLLRETDIIIVGIFALYRPAIITATAVLLNSEHVHVKPSL